MANPPNHLRPLYRVAKADEGCLCIELFHAGDDDAPHKCHTFDPKQPGTISEAAEWAAGPTGQDVRTVEKSILTELRRGFKMVCVSDDPKRPVIRLTVEGVGQRDCVVTDHAERREAAEWARAALGVPDHNIEVAMIQAAMAARAARDLREDTEKPATDADSLPTWNPPHLSQQVNAQRLVVELAGSARYSAARGAWLTYRDNEGRFMPDDTGDVTRAAKRVARRTWGFVVHQPDGISRNDCIAHARDSEKSSGISAMMKLAQTEAGISVAPGEMDRDTFKLNVLNGVVDLRTGNLLPHSRDDLLTKLAPVHYDANAKCPIWDQFLSRIMGENEDMIAYLSRVAGLCLTGDSSVQELFIPWGSGANGKSVFFDTLLGILGDYAGMAPDSLLTVRAQSEHPTELADLCGKRFVLASETEEGAKLKVQLVKRLTGDATIKGRFMRQDYFEFPRTHKLVLVTNNKPEIRETTNAIWRRVRLIPFTVVIPESERDTNLLARLRDEWSGVLAWCIRGCLDWQKQGMQTPPVVMAATEEYQSEQDPMREFLEERCTMGPRLEVSRADVWEEYQCWAKSSGIATPLNRNGLYDKLKRMPGVKDIGQQRRGDERPRLFAGIGLLNLSASYQSETERMSYNPREAA